MRNENKNIKHEKWKIKKDQRNVKSKSKNKCKILKKRNKYEINNFQNNHQFKGSQEIDHGC